MAGKPQDATKREEGMVTVATQFQTEGLPAPEAVNFTRIDRVGTEVQISVGYVDLNILVGIINQAKQGTLREASVKVDATHRLVFSLEAFGRLKAQMDQIAATLTADEAAGETAQTVR